MAVYGPFVTNYSVGNPVYMTVNRTSYRQKPITSTPLPYLVTKQISLTSGTVPQSLSTDVNTALKATALAKANSRFRSKVKGAESALGADLAERKQSSNMIKSRSLQLLKFSLQILRRDFGGAAKTLGVKKPKSLRSFGADLSGIWLEYSYGWKPLIADIGDAVQILQKPAPAEHCVGRATVRESVTTFKANPPNWHTLSYDRVYHAEVAADVYVSNQTVWMANQLGFTNPLSVAWEVVPFSFVVDWFIPVGKFLQSLNDYAGLGFLNPRYTEYGTFVRTDAWYFGQRDVVKGVSVQRVTALPSTVTLKPQFSGFYSARGANAIALLLQALKAVGSH